ncbi:nitric oxide synthase 1-like [Lampetra fluviatilis]
MGQTSSKQGGFYHSKSSSLHKSSDEVKKIRALVYLGPEGKNHEAWKVHSEIAIDRPYDGDLHTSAHCTLTKSVLQEPSKGVVPRSCPLRTTSCRARFTKIRNIETGHEFRDTLHLQSNKSGMCPGICKGSIMSPEELMCPSRDSPKPRAELLNAAQKFITQYYASRKGLESAEYVERLMEVAQEVEKRGTYDLTRDELIYGAKTAWRNAARCIGRIQWSKLQLFDARNCTTPSEMFTCICDHVKFASNGGNIRSTITVFRQRMDGQHDLRVWNSQLISYAGYRQPDGSILGDPAYVEFTELCVELGWQPPRTRFDVLPIVLQGNGEPELFVLPPELVLEVPIRHPKYDWFVDMGLRWYAVPAVANMALEVGGLEFTACPFNGWYMGTEIGLRDFCDAARFNIIEDVGKRLGLDTGNVTSLWKDQAAVEINIAVLHSYQSDKVTIVDHHTAAESFLKHMENEYQARGGCPADWVWIVPPMSSSLTPAFHQEMLNYTLSPSFLYQQPAWRRWKSANKQQAIGLKPLSIAVHFVATLMSRVMSRRIKATVLFASETGKSRAFAKTLCDIMMHAFNARVVCMQDYNMVDLEHEALVLVVTSTFGNGDPPENGETFFKNLTTLLHQCSSAEQKVGSLKNVRFSVFGLGSRAYPHFAAFGHAVDALLGDVGAERILRIGEGDELGGQEEAFRTWAHCAFQAACEVFHVGGGVSMDKVATSLARSERTWRPDRCLLVPASESPDLLSALSTIHKRKISSASLLSCENLQSSKSSRSTVLVRLDVHGRPELSYEPGDHLGVFPSNRDELVHELLARLQDTSPATQIMLLQVSRELDTPFGTVSEWQAEGRLPPCSLAQAFSHFLDITTPPSPQLLLHFAGLTDDEDERKRLHLLAKGQQAYEEWKWRGNPSVLEALCEFPGVRVPASLLVSQLPLLQPRYYSISSSPRAQPGQIHATVAVVSYRKHGGHGPLHHGVCSSWLSHIEPGHSVPCFVRPAPGFRLPSNPSLPCILIGPGTGIAPFRGFWQERLHDIEHRGVHPCGMMLLFGCRERYVDDIYRDEMELARSKGIFSEVHTAYSREPSTPKMYVQDLLRECLDAQVFSVLQERGGHLYVCGDVTMAGDVLKTLQQVLSRHGDISLEKAGQIVSRLRKEGRLHEDIFGANQRWRGVDSRPSSTPQG